MIRLLTALATIAAIAGPAAAAEVRVSLAGKDAPTIRAEIAAAAEQVCSISLTGKKNPSVYRLDPQYYEMMSCIDDTTTVALRQLDRISPAVMGQVATRETTTVAEATQ